MSARQFSLGAGLSAAVVGMLMGAALKPVEAKFQEPAAVKRLVSVTLTPSNRTQTPKAHWGIYALAEYRYLPSGKQTTIKKNELIVEEDMYIGQGGNFTRVGLVSGEYEIQIQPDNSRKIVKRFIVNNVSAATIPLNFNIAPIEDPEERKKTELVRIGPSLDELEARIKALEKKAGIGTL